MCTKYKYIFKICLTGYIIGLNFKFQPSFWTGHKLYVYTRCLTAYTLEVTFNNLFFTC